MGAVFVAAGVLLLALLVLGARRRFLFRRSLKRLQATSRPPSFSELEHALLGPAPQLRIPGVAGGPTPGLPGVAASDYSPAPPSWSGGEVGLAAAAAADGATPAAEYAWKWSQVDDHLFQAIGQMTHESVRSVADMAHAVGHWEGLSAWSGPTQALVQSVKGHLGEFLVQDHALAAGHSVAMAELSNQPGWDLAIDGHLANVKTAGDAATALGRHFAHYPDIPALLPHDAAHIPADALHFDPTHAIDFDALHTAGGHVLVDDALSNAHVASMAHDGLDVASGHIGLHLPWITLAVTSYREGKRLLAGHTDLLGAVKNVGVTTAAVGVAGGAGAKTGALLGTMIAPGIGTAIGAAIGGIGGGLLGRKIANDIRLKAVREAEGRYRAAVSAFQQVSSATALEVGHQWQAFETWAKAGLAAQARAATEQATQVVSSARQDLARAQQLDVHDAGPLLDRSREALQGRADDAAAAFLAAPWWRRYLAPRALDAERYAAHRHLQQALEDWDVRRSSLRPDAAGRMRVEPVLDLALVSEEGETAAKGFVARLAALRLDCVRRAERAAEAAVSATLLARARTVESLRAKQVELVALAEQRMRPTLSALSQALDQLISEMVKADIPVPAGFAPASA